MAGVPSWLGGQISLGPLVRIFHPVPYPFSAPLLRIVQIMDSIALAGMVLGFVLALIYWLRHREQTPAIAALLFVVSLIPVSNAHFWDTSYGYCRPFAPMLFLVASEAVRRRHAWVWLLPCILIDLRIFMQLAPQVYKVAAPHG